ncbi:MAG: TlyA family RNA methyltransferase, partial [Lactobacillus sp.]|nr:TlyA family RNA methyltransferase [Lactobacillus sp.]
TGGFTDVALQNGAKLVYALDVGYNQLAWKLRDNPQVVVMEKQNFRYSKPEDFTDGLPDFAMTDVSFISLDLIMPPMYKILKDKCDAVCLIKPQFEAGPENVGKHGIVHDHEVHANVIKHTMEVAQKIGFNILRVDYSPIKGGKGNIEFLIHLGKDIANPGQDLWKGNPSDVVQRAVNGL